MFFYKHTHAYTRNMQTTKYTRPPYFKTLHSRYYRLPKVLWDLIWTYDDRYRIDFKQCVNELNRYFNHNRVVDKLIGEIQLYNIYLDIYKNRKQTTSLYRNVEHFHDYILSKHNIFGDLVQTEYLNYHNLKPLHPPSHESENNVNQYTIS